MRVARRSLGIVVLCILCGCRHQDHHAEWGDEWEGPQREVVQYRVHGWHDSGEPINVRLFRFRRGSPGQPAFEWTTTCRPDGTYEVQLDGRVISPTKGVRLFVNGPDGKVRELPADAALLGRLFRGGANPSREEILEFWDRHVQPLLEENRAPNKRLRQTGAALRRFVVYCPFSGPGC
jgi:hypothetical protein